MPSISLLVFNTLFIVSYTADIVIRIPGDLSQQNGFYRLNYHPPIGEPKANTTFKPQDISDVIKFSHGQPGTKYDFWLYYTNSTISDWLSWTASITTVPDPPSNLSLQIQNGKTVIITWNPPGAGEISAYKLKVIPISEPSKSVRSLVIRDNGSPFELKDLTPGARYTIQLFTVYENKESPAYIQTNFTTRPNTPGRFIVWFRNETTLLVLWQPPYPPGLYSDYKVSISPPDADVSETYVQKEGEPPGPAQAAFNGLIPGRAYDISVETVSDNEISDPTTSQYRTVPWRPYNVTFDSIEPYSFEVRWSGPREISEFDRYQVAIGIRRKTQQDVPRGEELSAKFTENLSPGHTYQVVVKTVSGSVASWPATGNVTTRPLPVREISTKENEKSSEIIIVWSPHPESYQDHYKITYHEVTAFNGDSGSASVFEPSFSVNNLQPGRNYTISIQAVSKGIESKAMSIFKATRPSSPIIEDVAPILGGLNISWKSDVTSKQEKYTVIYTRNDTGKSTEIHSEEPHVILSNLYPGGGYSIKLFAVSNGLKSEPHNFFTAVLPNPPLNLSILEVLGNRVTLQWYPPIDSLYTGYVIRYRTREDDENNSSWTEVPDIEDTKYELDNLRSGEQFEISIDSVSHKVPSQKPLSVTTIINPSSVVFNSPLLDAENITLFWKRPEGRIENYLIKWFPRSNPEDIRDKNLLESDYENGVLLGGLHPGVEYIFEVITVSYTHRSQVSQTIIRTKPLITSELLILTKKENPESITLKYTITPLTKSLFDTYRFILGNGVIEKAAQDPDRRVTFNNLTPGRLYNISLFTVSGGVESKPLQRVDRLHPNPVSNISSQEVLSNEISLSWSLPEGDYDFFDVQYLSTEDILIQNISITNSITLTNLRPYHNYTFSIITTAGGVTLNDSPRRSRPLVATFRTKESVPGPLSSFEPTDISPSSISFEWSLPPLESNGILRGFVISYGLKSKSSSSLTPSSFREFEAGETRGRLINLLPGQDYVFSIQGKTEVGLGESRNWEQSMPIWPPPPPPNTIKPLELSHSRNSISVEFHKNFFSDENGPVISYAVIVAEDSSKETSSKLTLPKWQDARSFTPWPPYQASSPYYPFSNKTHEVYIIGSQICDESSPSIDYCNGPLKSGVAYRVKIRAFTTREKFVETNWSDSILTDPDNTAFLLGIIIPLLLLLLLVILLLCFRKMKRSSSGSGCVQRRRKNKNREMRQNDNISLADSVLETSKPVKLKDFAEHYRIMSADSDFRFSEEYEELKHVGRDKPCSAADLPINRPKNRFTNILPYDHSRVKLQPTDDEEGSDFMNANFVPGFNSPREFVVTQGCLHSTRDDFWRMCWETNSRAIVMLTRCIEKGREKCDHYWPYDTQPVYYGDIAVTILNESHFPDWNISEFRLMRGDTVRSIRHFHFTTWPDFGVPDPPQTLVRFVRAFRERISPEQRPIVVHCSAGVGRSGTFIALDRILQVIRHSDVVDIFGIVHEMRKERVWMVQTEQQYICIHQCLLVVLDGKENDSPNIHEIHENEGFEDDEGIAESGM